MPAANPEDEATIGRFREVCFAIPGATEKLSHGEPAFFVKGRQFANVDNHHHGALHLSAWVAASLEAQEILIDTRPERFFRPPYVGHRGWVGIILDTNPDWDEVALIVSQAAETVSAKRR